MVGNGGAVTGHGGQLSEALLLHRRQPPSPMRPCLSPPLVTPDLGTTDLDPSSPPLRRLATLDLGTMAPDLLSPPFQRPDLAPSSPPSDGLGHPPLARRMRVGASPLFRALASTSNATASATDPAPLCPSLLASASNAAASAKPHAPSRQPLLTYMLPGP